MNKFKTILRQSYIFVILLFIYLPLFIIVILSFNGVTERGNVNLTFGEFDKEKIFATYKSLAEGDFLTPLTTSLIVALVSTPISVFIATITAFGIWRNKKVYQKLTMSVSNTSIVVPDIISGLSLIIFFIAVWVSLSQPLGLFTIIVSHISISTPFALVSIYPRMLKMNPNLILASQDLGYNKVQTFFKITLSYLAPSLVVGGLIAFATSFDDFIITSYVRGSARTIATELYSIAKGVKGWAIAFGSILVFIGILATVFSVIKKAIAEKINYKEKVVRSINN
ncbi:ABC transporter permease [Mycoplasma bradburyae]|uniref:ABC transporter permease n=1 Tax=Mycoplasma bradburyae TaxID=2963128 RepID=A0AAW6HQ24_9MOLU|nr:ABC transporter permease [Mycoplasma bradburyae]MDC4163474.1 ABC transporter permease [Mycoplasma bradburyae]MDC4182075.1 ABC transporter permease [Mycoplasma bradburyae]MDC4182848.1 ABC transporter permease [Mycoplasma bradburyae]MDC4183522.1 ABC transporter permease [Mycoplasma bradburyae]MDC4184261.1 ABC transporter permease [Mycoplasma bradburyae]